MKRSREKLCVQNSKFGLIDVMSDVYVMCKVAVSSRKYL